MAISLILLLTSVFGAALVSADSNPGTTPHLQEIFIGRCWDYQLIKYKSLAPDSPINCTKLWAMFFKSFSFQAPCDLTMSHYDEFMDTAKQTLPKNKVMFWSGTYVIAHEYARDSRLFVTLEDTLIGYLVNSLVWCGQSTPPGMNLTRCPSWTDCPLEASESFWAAASKTFASSGQGVVTLVLDGSREDKPAYSKSSFFAKYELISLGDVSSVTIIVTHKLGGPVKETCSKGSILDLKADIAKHGLKYTCIDDPPAIVHLLCAEDPTASECKLVTDYMYSATAPKATTTDSLSFNRRPDIFNSDL